MLRLPASLERRLAELFPRIREREKFVAQVLEEALAGKELTQDEQPEYVGGTLHLFTDGGSRGNPGQAAIAAILEDPVRGVVLKELKETIGVETNNVAEYKALIEGLRMSLPFQPNRLICHLDSELVVKQLNGEYRVKMEALRPYFDEIQELAAELPDVVFQHIPREDNYRADALVNQALDSERSMTGPRPLPAKPNPPFHRDSPAQRPLWDNR